MKTLKTRRLLLREASNADAAFLVRLMNEPAYLRLIGDRGVRTVLDAHDYLATAPIFRYCSERLGFNIVELADGGTPLGICGLVRRDSQGDVEIGYAISDMHAGQGYATEAAAATLEHAHGELAFARLTATTLKENAASRRVLEKIGMKPREISDPEDSVRGTCRYLSIKHL